jgi:sterol desaturase/sphingolipid hydroxylase (fatty acid hydroxylase superfamily)
MLDNYSWLQFGADTFYMCAALLVWTFTSYWLHRISHISHSKNPLWHIHRAHHKIPYLGEPTGSIFPRIGQFFMWLGTWRTSLDVIIVLTIPAVIIAIVAPRYGIPILIFHYFYEVFCSEYALDHNPRIKGFVTKIFAWGDFHLYHHMSPKNNFGLIITFWDRVFGTSVDPKPGTSEKRQQQLLNTRAKRA